VEDLERLKAQREGDDRARDLRERLAALLALKWGDSEERRRRAERRAKLLPLLRSLTPEQCARIARDPACLARFVG
jgi:hypothetical protein